MIERDPQRLFAPPAVALERRADGALLLRSLQPLAAYARCVGDWLCEWARRRPDQTFIAEREPGGAWQRLSYAESLRRVRRLAAWLLQQPVAADRPVVILSGNSIEHALLSLAAMHVGVPIVPVSPAYSLLSGDFGKLKEIIALVDPGVIFVAGAAQFGSALAAIRELHSAVLLTGAADPRLSEARNSAAAHAAQEFADVDRAFAAVGPDTVAKILFTSGSTGSPKGVINTQRMLCANQQQIAQVWPFAAVTPPVIVDWLPWNHTFGGNHNFNLILRTGGTLYIDEGRPAPSLIERTVANLRDIAPTIYLNVPRGFDTLIPRLRADEALRSNFFSRLQVIFYGAAALPQHLWDALEQLSLAATGERVVMVAAWGSTETAPLTTSCHFRAQRAGVIGLPVPGCELKLVPLAQKLEVRVRGPHVMPGYWQQPDITAKAFDSEGYYLIGDAVRLVDEGQPELGLCFDGRIAEDFKLASGTWVNTGALRIKALAALGTAVQDLVVAGHDRDEVGLLLFPNLAHCRTLCENLPATALAEEVVTHPQVRAVIRAGLEQLRREGTGSSTFATRALLMVEGASVDAGEITDKGYINQGAVLARRATLVARLFAAMDADDVVMLT